MYTFTDITLTHKKLWHKTFVKNGQICEGCGSLKALQTPDNKVLETVLVYSKSFNIGLTYVINNE